MSIDPTETPEIAARTQAALPRAYGRPEAREGWHFLTGQRANVRRSPTRLDSATATTRSARNTCTRRRSPCVTPDGRIARYLYGIEFPPKTLRLSLVEASEGKIGTTVDRLILYCFHYDSSEGRYAPVAVNIMRLGGGLTASSSAAF